MGGWYLQGPDGNELDLQSATVKILRGLSGILFPSVVYTTQRSPFGGDIVVDRHVKGRNLDMPLWVKAVDGQTWRGALAHVLEYLSDDPARPSYLIWRGAAARRLAVVLRGGASWSTRDTGVDWARVMVPLYAPDPAWEDEMETSASLGTVESMSFLPLFPFQLTAANLLAQAGISILGYTAFPVWTVTGGASGIYITNDTTEDILEFPNLTLAVGDKLVVDTRPGAVRAGAAVQVHRASGSVENAFGEMTAVSKLWHLQHGINVVTVQTLSNDENATVMLRYRERHDKPWEVIE